MREPLVPEVGRAHEALVGLVERLRPAVVAPGERDERGVAVVHGRTRPRARALEPEAQVGGEAQPDVGLGRGGDAAVVAVAVVLPVRPVLAVVEHGVAVDVHLDLPVDAAQGAQQDVLGVVVGGGAAVRVGALLLVVPGADEQHVAHDAPARAGPPRGLEHVRARDVAAAGRGRLVGRADAEAAGVAVEDRAEHRRAVHARHAEPLDVARGRDERVASQSDRKP